MDIHAITWKEWRRIRIYFKLRDGPYQSRTSNELWDERAESIEQKTSQQSDHSKNEGHQTKVHSSKFNDAFLLNNLVFILRPRG
jgi:hypothetical protein